MVDHDARRLVWAAPGRDKATVSAFFDLLGEQPCAQITHVRAGGADFIDAVLAARCPGAVRVADPFHVVKWASDALDEVRREAWNEAHRLARGEPKRGRGRPLADALARPGSERATTLKGARYALWKNPEDLTEHRQAKLSRIAVSDPRLHRAYLLKEGLRLIFRMTPAEATEALDRWTSGARRCRIPAFVKRQCSIVKHRAKTLAGVEQHLSNGLVESTNTKVRLITRMAYGVRLTRTADRLGAAQPRRPPHHPPRPELTHGCDRRANFGLDCRNVPAASASIASRAVRKSGAGNENK